LAALQLIVTASDEQLLKNLESITPEDIKRISRLVVSSLPDAKDFADELVRRPDESAAIRKAHERLYSLFGSLHPKKWIVLATWLCITSGIATTIASPGTIPEISSQVTILGLGVAITGITSNHKKD
jgi:hypothetical protein